MVQLTRYNRNTPMPVLPLLQTDKWEQPRVCLQTCSRVELYSGNGFVDEGTVRHLFRVVSGLESGLVGETGIQGQVKEAYITACKNYNLGTSIHKLFQCALHVGKVVRTRTALSRGAMSYSQATVNLLRDRMSDLSESSITILGVHNMNSNLLHYLTRNGASAVFIGNRTFDKAARLAQKHKATAFDFSMLESRLKVTDVLISATSAPHHVVTTKIFPPGKGMIIFDLAVPLDVDPQIGRLPGVELYNVAWVESTVEQNISLRRDAISKAEALVEELVNEYMANQEKRLDKTLFQKAV